MPKNNELPRTIKELDEWYLQKCESIKDDVNEYFYEQLTSYKVETDNELSVANFKLYKDKSTNEYCVSRYGYYVGIEGKQERVIYSSSEEENAVKFMREKINYYIAYGMRVTNEERINKSKIEKINKFKTEMKFWFKFVLSILGFVLVIGGISVLVTTLTNDKTETNDDEQEIAHTNSYAEGYYLYKIENTVYFFDYFGRKGISRKWYVYSIEDGWQATDDLSDDFIENKLEFIDDYYSEKVRKLEVLEFYTSKINNKQGYFYNTLDNNDIPEDFELYSQMEFVSTIYNDEVKALGAEEFNLGEKNE